MIIFLYFSVPLLIKLSSFPKDSKSAGILKSEKTLFHEPGVFFSNKTGGAIIRERPSSSPESIAAIYVFPKPTTSERKTPPYSSKTLFAFDTASF